MNKQKRQDRRRILSWNQKETSLWNEGKSQVHQVTPTRVGDRSLPSFSYTPPGPIIFIVWAEARTCVTNRVIIRTLNSTRLLLGDILQMTD